MIGAEGRPRGGAPRNNPCSFDLQSQTSPGWQHCRITTSNPFFEENSGTPTSAHLSPNPVSSTRSLCQSCSEYVMATSVMERFTEKVQGDIRGKIAARVSAVGLTPAGEGPDYTTRTRDVHGSECAVRRIPIFNSRSHRPRQHRHRWARVLSEGMPSQHLRDEESGLLQSLQNGSSTASGTWLTHRMQHAPENSLDRTPDDSRVRRAGRDGFGMGPTPRFASRNALGCEGGLWNSDTRYSWPIPASHASILQLLGAMQGMGLASDGGAGAKPSPEVGYMTGGMTLGWGELCLREEFP